MAIFLGIIYLIATALEFRKASRLILVTMTSGNEYDLTWILFLITSLTLLSKG